MKRLIFLLVTIFSFLYSIASYSSDDGFLYEPIIYNFTGAVSNDNSVVAYSNINMVMTSTDQGNNWKQYQVTELKKKATLVRMRTVDNQFVGALYNGDFVYSNDGINWTERTNDCKGIVDFDIYNDKYYLLLAKKILVLDSKLNLLDSLVLDSITTANRLDIINNSIIINATYRKMIFIDPQTMQISKRVTLPKFSGFGEYYAHNINFHDNMLFMNMDTCLVVSNDFGSTWELLADSVFAYTIKNGDILTAKICRMTKSYFAVQKIRINRMDTACNTTMVFDDYYDRMTQFLNPKELHFFGDKNLVLVGLDKFIAVSNDNADSWQLKCNSIANYNFFCYDDKHIISIKNNNIFNSSDGGNIWLPAKNSSYMYGIYDSLYAGSHSSMNSAQLDNNGKGIFFEITSTIQFTDYILIDDWGNDITAVLDTNLYLETNNESFSKKIGDSIYIYQPNPLYCYDSIFQRSDIITFSDNFNFTNESKLQKYNLQNVQLMPNGNMLAFAQSYDCDKGIKNTFYTHSLESTDNGITWNELAMLTTRPKETSGQAFDVGDEFYTFFEDDKLFVIRTKYITTDSTNRMTLRSQIWDYREGTLLKDICVDTIDNQSFSVFIMGDKRYLKYGNTMLSCNVNDSELNWQNVELDFIISTIPSLAYNNSMFVSVILESVGGSLMVRMTPKYLVSVKETTEEYKDYLYLFPPYPNPANKVVRTMMYWTETAPIDEADINIYDSMGNKVAGKETTFLNKLSSYNGILEWNCQGQPSGVYLIVITHGTNTQTIKCALSR